MRPRIAPNDLPNVPAGHPKPPRDLCPTQTASIQSANGKHLRFGQLRRAYRVATQSPLRIDLMPLSHSCAVLVPESALAHEMPPFVGHVDHVVLMCAIEQVLGVAAIADVAPVAGLSVWPLAVSQEEGQTVTLVRAERTIGSHTSGEPRVLKVWRLTRVLSAVRTVWPLPSPASTLWSLARRLVNVAPKSINILLSEIGRIKIWFMHDLKQTFRVVIGSDGVQPSFEPPPF